MSYETKDSGKRQDYASGMVRDLQIGKARFDLIEPLFLSELAEKNKELTETSINELISLFVSIKHAEKDKDFNMATEFCVNIASLIIRKSSLSFSEVVQNWAELMQRGADKYGENNWQLASSEEERARFYQSGFRHAMQFMSGQTDEDHQSAVLFNLAAYLFVWRKLDER